ncbi:cation:proton antiporter [Hwanghaeella grinnelliae]|uniref:Cation:proton antiporter n=1 Tax=Hwanghaeella grinnelliae TaxID=2500179 RepID=A0A3S2W810_9PROT|nr:cation:proton antiporter [Hwanghaeella grinnelliae]RVU35025.1 cation:proton antiporter [Hwanghaeella grinnelliae]
MHEAADLTGVAVVVVAATLCGMLFVRLRQPAIVGYIIAGVILGPSGLALVANREAISFFAELGVILLLYFIGMELSLRSFRHIWRVAVVTTAFQIGISVGATALIGQFFDLPTSHIVLFGFALALSSTAVAVKILDDIGELRNRSGRVAIGILIAQDLAVAPMLLFVTSFAGDGFNPIVLVEVAASIGVLVSVILFMSRRQRVNLPFHQILEAKKEIGTMGSLALCFLFATLAGLFGMSPAFGAFLAGLIVGNSGQRQVMHENAEPVQAVLLMVFFLSIGLLINLQFIWENIGLVLAIGIFVMFFKTMINIIALRIQGETMQTAFLASLTIGQMGEFTFVLGGAAAGADVIDNEVYRLLVGVTVLSLITSPIYVDLARRLSHRSVRNATSLRKVFRLVYRQEWRFTKATSLWFWHIANDAVEVFENMTSGMRTKAKARIDEIKMTKEAAEKAKEQTAPQPPVEADPDATRQEGEDHPAPKSEKQPSRFSRLKKTDPDLTDD